MSPSPRFSPARVFRLLLRAFPIEFRVDHGREMEQMFRAQRREAQEEGRMLAVARLWIETVGDLLKTAPGEHVAILRQDAAYAVRALRRAPVFACTAILTLAIGIGATTALYTIINAFLFRPLPVSHPEELVSISTLDRHIELPHGLSMREPSILEARDAHALRVLGRLKSGVSLQEARAALGVTTTTLGLRYPETNKGVSLFVVPETQARPEPPTGPWFHIVAVAFAALAGLLLLITSANIANLLLSRAATRGREVAIRTAMGARRGRLVRQFLTESLMLAGLAGGVAMLLGWLLVDLFTRQNSGFSADVPLRVDPGDGSGSSGTASPLKWSAS